jgi:phage-related protein
MGRLGAPAAEAFGRTWQGISSSFRDIIGQLGRALTSPAFETLKRNLAAVNAYLLRHRNRIGAVLDRLGTRLAGAMQLVFDRGRVAFLWLVDHWSLVERRFSQTVDRARELLPTALRVAQASAVLMVALRGAGALLSGLGMLGGVMSGLSSLGVGLGGGGAAATAAGGTAAAAAGGGGLGAIFAPLLAVAGPLAAVLGAVVAAGVAVWRAFVNFGDGLRMILEPVWADFQAIGSDLMVFFTGLWTALEPQLSFLGVVIVGGVTLALRNVLPVIRVFTGLLRGLGRALSWAGDAVIRPVFGVLSESMMGLVMILSWLGDAVRDLVYLIRRIPGMGGPGAGDIISGDLPGETSAAPFRGPSYSSVPRERPNSTPPARPQPPVNDFRGSTINVRQDFREADPDNVWMVLREGLEREATRRLRSGFSPALG